MALDLLNVGDNRAVTKAKMDAAFAEAGLPASGDTTEATDTFNEMVTDYLVDPLPGLTDGMAGGTARSRINAAITAIKTGGLRFLVAPGHLVNDCTDHTQFAASGGSKSNNTDPTYIREGRATSIRYTTGTSPTAGNTYALRLTPADPIIEPTGRFGAWVYVVDYTKLTAIALMVRLNGVTKTYTHSMADSDKKHNGWVFLTAEKIGFSTPGNEWNTQTIDRIEVRLIPNSTSEAYVYVSGIERGFVARPQLLITSDDGYDSDYTLMRPELNSRGLKATFGIIGSTINNPSNMTEAQLATLYSEGHDLVPHGLTNLTTVTIEEAADEVDLNRDWLTSRGWARGQDFYIYPNGGYNQDIIDMLKGKGFKAARAVSFGPTYNHALGFDDGRYCLPIIGVGPTITPANVLAALDATIAKGNTAILMFHRITTGSTSGDQYGRADMIEIFDGIVDRLGQIDVLTMSDWYDRSIA